MQVQISQVKAFTNISPWQKGLNIARILSREPPRQKALTIIMPVGFCRVLIYHVRAVQPSWLSPPLPESNSVRYRKGCARLHTCRPPAYSLPGGGGCSLAIRGRVLSGQER